MLKFMFILSLLSAGYSFQVQSAPVLQLLEGSCIDKRNTIRLKLVGANDRDTSAALAIACAANTTERKSERFTGSINLSGGAGTLTVNMAEQQRSL